MTRSGLIAAVLLVAVLPGCGDDHGPFAAGPGSAGVGDPSRWVSVEVTEDGAARTLVDGTRIDLRFEEGEISADAGCNHLFGEYSIRGEVLDVGPMGGTEMGCPPELHEQDQWLTGFLRSSPTIDTTDDSFVLTSRATEIRFVDRAVAEPDVDLVGPTWDVTGFVEGDTAMSTTAGTDHAWVRFEGDGVVRVDDGCNDSSWRYEVEGSTVRFDELRRTLVRCPEEGQHARVLAPFEAGSAAVEIDGTTMTLLAADGRGVTFAAG